MVEEVANPTVRTKSKTTRPRPVYMWNVLDVQKWLRRHCSDYYQLYYEKFLHHDITGRALLRISDNSLRRIGIDNEQHRMEIWREIMKLHLKTDMLELKDIERLRYICGRRICQLRLETMDTKVNSNKIVDISHEKFEICRLCGEKSLQYVPIFEDKNNFIPEKISKCLPIIIFPNDNLPSNVCRCCLNYLNISCKLILTAVEVDRRLRIQLDQTREDTIFINKDVATYEKPKISEPIIRPLSLKELKRRAIIGPIECDLCDLNFQNVNTFDSHMEQFHFLKWRCSLCDNSFYESNELITHKALRHSGNIVICNSCQHTDQNNKQIKEITDKSIQNDQNNKKIRGENIQNDQINAQEIMEEKNVQKDPNNEQEFIDKKNVQNYQNNNTLEIIEKTIQNDQKREQEITDKNSYEKEIVPFTKNDEMAASVDLAMDIAKDIVEMDIVEAENENNSIQALLEQTDDNSDSETDKIIEKYKRFLERLKEKELLQKEKLFCDSCKICFGDERHFKAHNKIHEERTVTCTKCSTECSSTYDLFLHKREKHNMYKTVQLKYMCNKCGKFFTHSWRWEAHNEDECSRMMKRCCKYCNAVFETHLKLIRHLRKHKWEMFDDPTVTVYKCVACPKIFVDKELHEKHRNVHDPECWDKFRCTTCDRPFRDKIRLRDHQLSIHQNVKPYDCNICGRSFLRLYEMKSHHKTHFGHECNRCNAVFKKGLDLAKHIQETHGLEPPDSSYTKKNYICRFCGKKLSTYQSLTNHERIHTGEMPFSCPICHRSFRSCTSRWTHVQRHQKGTFVCEHCGKCFSYKQNLIAHVSTHLSVEDRKYQCNICGKKFLRNCYLTIHRRIHEGLRPFKCDVCSLSFTQKGDMKRHRMRHFKKAEPVKNT